MLKPVCAILTILIIIPVLAIANSEFDLNVGNYTAIVKIDEKGELSKRGKISVPYLLNFVHDLDTGLVYGTMVGTELVLDKKGNPESFGLTHYTVKNVKTRNEKKIKFDVALGETTIMEKVKGTFSDSANVITLALRNSSNKKVKQTFVRTTHQFAGIFIGNMKTVTPGSVYYPRTGDTVVCMQIAAPKPTSSVAGTVVGKYSLATMTFNSGMFSGNGTLLDAGTLYWGKNDATHNVDIQVDYNKKKLTKFKSNNTGQWVEGKLTNMGGNGKSPKLLSDDHIVVDRFDPFVKITLRNPQNVDPGCQVSIGNPWIGMIDIYSSLSNLWLDKDDNDVEENNLQFVLTNVPPEFSGPLLVTLTNPDGKSSSFLVNIPEKNN